jgi:NADH-quinone oxidoreductase subunit E
MAFSKFVVDKIIELKSRYPVARSALLPALQIVQEERGSLDSEGIEWLAQQFNLAAAEIIEVASSYSLLRRTTVGKYHIQICRTLSCAICGATDLKEAIEERLHLQEGLISPDGMWSYEEVECLGACGGAPALMINDVLFENVSPEKFDQIITRIEKDKPTLRFSAKREALGTTARGFRLSELNFQR